ncbi:MAG: preprotein translocase subunit SecA [Patescibacteria group bacterium]|nr:preprotein translocase subunit SecA [Patescibacteria group bacterium]
MLRFIRNLLDYNEQQLQNYRKQLAVINSLEEKARNLADADFPRETQKLREVVQSQEQKLDAVVPWAFALVREAARRKAGMRHYDVQMIAGLALNDGKIIEQKTGEGKTLTATSALYVNALAGKGSHLVTVNDYLARRDAGWMGMIFDFLGMTTAAIISEQSFIYDRDYNDTSNPDWRLARLKPVSRKEAYQADITYGINSEFGFDYLRDNMAQQPGQIVQRDFHYAVVDEADSVLIDEARTPHIISAPYEEDTSKYYEYARIVKKLDMKEDVIIDEKLRTAHLSDTGIRKIEQMLGVENVYQQDYDTLFHIEAAVKAHALYHNNKDYIVRDGEVIIVDEFTGRLLNGRRFSEGLHQALEAKEGVPIKKESRTLATVSLQNYFRMYRKLAGMTGTAATEAEEFGKIYNTEVVVIPTNRPSKRIDHPDVIYKTVAAKFNAIAEEVAKQHKTGRPVLIGTTSIEKNELLSGLLKKRGIPHEVLNAKNHEREAQIIARAGEKGAVTVATNMAGRGVDIILGGEQPVEFEMEAAEYKKAIAKWQEAHDEVVRLGGLMVIGTERHESRRIDNQLRGRAGRQGDPGESMFFISLEDDLMRIFGGEQISRLMTAFNLPEDQPLSHSIVSRAIEQAQVKVEGFNFDIRKRLVEYDDVLNRQRDIIYSWRRKFMNLAEENREEFDEVVLSVFDEVFTSQTADFFAIRQSLSKEHIDTVAKDIDTLFPGSLGELPHLLKEKSQDEVQEYLLERASALYAEKEKIVGDSFWAQIVRSLFLSTVDQFWTEHLTAIDDLREGINLRGYAQMDPLVEYKNEAFRMFESLIANIGAEFTRRVLNIELNIQSPTQQAESESAGNSEISAGASPAPAVPYARLSETAPKARKLVYHAASGADPYRPNASAKPSRPGTPVSAAPGGVRVVDPGQVQPKKRPGRNDPCWCGSGKKYKKCHYPN